MLRYLHIIIAFVLLLASGQFLPLYGQSLTVVGTDDEQKIIDRYAAPLRQHDSLGVIQAVSRLVSDLQKDGYFQAKAADLSKVDSAEWQVAVTTGPRYDWAFLSAGNLSPLMLEKTGFRERFFLNKPFSYQDIQVLMERILVAAENEGFPFASVRLAEVEIEGEQIHAELSYRPGPYITFGVLHIHGTEKVKADFLATQLRISEGSAYSEKKVNRISSLIRTILFLELTEPVSVRFQNDEAEVHLSLSDRESDQVDALLNFLPNENEPGTLLLTGQAEVSLNNLMRSGKQLSLQWRRLQLETQQLSLTYRHPYLFRTPLEAGFSFQLLKEDTLFLNRKLGFQLSYPTAYGDKWGIDTEWHNSSQLGEGTLPGISSQLADFNVFNTQLSLEINRLNDALFPSKGIYFSGSLGIGRKVLRNNTTEQVQTEFWQPSAQLSLRQYWRMGNLWVLYHRVTGALVHSEALFLNELYRLGGLSSLRGFNDNFFFASHYALSNLELRLLLEQARDVQSYLYIFYDQGVVGHSLPNDAYFDLPMGVGAGLSLSTRAGIFSFAYALGKTQSTNFNLAVSKIHFGYISRF